MDAGDFRDYLLSKTQVTEEEPFGPDVLVYKVKGKMFATLTFDEKDGLARSNLKCDPEWAVELREEHESIIPGYHMNKKHWNTIVLDGSIPKSLVIKMADHSYQLVVAKLPKKIRDELGES